MRTQTSAGPVPWSVVTANPAVRRAWLVHLVALLLALVAVVPAHAAIAEHQLVYTAPGASALPLDGARPTGRAVIELSPGAGAEEIDTVTFTVDGRVLRTEQNPPWVLSGNDARGKRALDTSTLAPGEHTVTAEVATATGVSTVRAVFTVGQAAAAEQLSYSLSPDYAEPRALEGAVLSGAVAVFLDAAQDAAAVTFALDGQVVRTETVRPYDLSADTGGRSHLLDTSALAVGSHRVTAEVTTTTGEQRTVAASFTTAAQPTEPPAGTTRTLTVQGDGFLLDGAPFDMWGVRTASATYDQAQTDHLIAQLDTYLAHGVNTVAVYYMGSRNANYDPFSPDGRSVDAGHQDRMEQIIRAADARGMVVVVGIFYQAAPFGLRDAAAVREAVRTVATELLPFRNVVLNIANEQNTGEYEDSAHVFDLRRPEAIVELLSVVHDVDPDRVAGGGGYYRPSNIAIGRSPEADVLLFDTTGSQQQLTEYREFVAAGITKPVVNVEQFGAYTNRYPRGEFPAHVRSKYGTEIRTAAQEPGLYTFLHNGPWLQVLPMRYDLGGQGTAQDPGVRWYFEAVRAARGLGQ